MANKHCSGRICIIQEIVFAFIAGHFTPFSRQERQDYLNDFFISGTVFLKQPFTDTVWLWYDKKNNRNRYIRMAILYQ